MKAQYIKKTPYGITLLILFLIPMIYMNNPVKVQDISDGTQVKTPGYSITYTNQTQRMVFTFNHALNETIMDNFTAANGIIISGPWNVTNGFAGIINVSSSHLGEFLKNITDVQVYPDAILQAQMNSVHHQLQTFPGIINSTHYNITGNSNASIAFLDSGIDDSHILFNNGYEEGNFQKKIVSWNDIVGDSLNPSDPFGHGTSIASIAVGGGNSALEPTYMNGGLSVTVGGNFSHYDLFYPNHIAPKVYQIKMASFNMAESNAMILINGSVQEMTTNQLKTPQLELYRNGILVNSSVASGNNMDLIWNVLSNQGGIFDVIFKYSIDFGGNPSFKVLANFTMIPYNKIGNFANFSGIAPQTKVISLKILNNTGLGYSSDLLTALDYVWANNSLYNIAASVLSIGNFDMDDNLAITLGLAIDFVIDNGTMVVIAAGNKGVGTDTLNKLAFSQKAIVVGAVNDRDQITYYSSQGKALNSRISKPDIVAPGGSILRNRSMIITAETNNKEPNTETYELVNNDLTAITGTSVAASIIAGIYNLVLEKLGGWSTFGKSGDDVLAIKSLLLMTATETNLNREDDPITTYQESQDSPIMNRGTPDIHEGYGRVNPLAIMDLLNNTFTMNTTKAGIALTSSPISATGTHVYAVNVTLEQRKIYQFNLSYNTPLFDVDMYLYSTKPDVYGRPIILNAANQAGFASERFYFSNPNATGTYYLVIKAVTGAGSFNLSIFEQQSSIPPILNNSRVEAGTTAFDSLDIYTFWVNYTSPENYPPTYVYLHLNCTSENITMTLVDDDPLFTNGAFYSVNYKFWNPGIYAYNFSVLMGNFSVDLINGTTDFLINITQIQRIVDMPYHNDFDDAMDTSNWTLTNLGSIMTYDGTSISVTDGWKWISVANTQENRYNDKTNWGAFYCGITQGTLPLLRNNIPNYALANIGGTFVKTNWGAFYCGITQGTLPLLRNNIPNYALANIGGTFDLQSPHIYLNQSQNSDFWVKLGVRISLGASDSVAIQIRANRSAWITLQSYSNIQMDWFSVEFNLSTYINNYVELRVHAIYSPNTSDNGFMLDDIVFETPNRTNNFAPQISNITGTGLASPLPYYQSINANKFSYYTFQALISDTDGRLPQFAFLEINKKNYTMSNIYGKWFSNYTSGQSYHYGVVYQCDISLFGITNTTYRFHTYDGKYYVSTAWQNTIRFSSNPEPLAFPLDKSFYDNQTMIYGDPMIATQTNWMNRYNTWHRMEKLGTYSNPDQWYCGVGNLLGYDNNWNVSLVTPIVNLNGTNEIFLYFTHGLSFQSNNANDKAQVYISLNDGDTWTLLATYTSNTQGNVSIAIDLTKYMTKNATFRFNFYSDGIGNRQAGNGWLISNIRIGINASRDYEKPVIIYVGVTNRQSINGTFVLRIQLLDNRGINKSLTKFYFNGKLKSLIENGDYFEYTFDTSNFTNGEEIEFSTFAYDLQNNKAIKKIIFIIENPMPLWEIILIYVSIIAAAIFVAALVISRIRIAKLMASGDYIPKPSFIERLSVRANEKKRIKDEVQAVAELHNKEWEKKQPFTLFCKNCKKWFKSTEFEIYCPACTNDSLYIAKKCPICTKWKLFEDEGKHECKQCKVVLLKDFDAAKAEINSRNIELKLSKADTLEEINK